MELELLFTFIFFGLLCLPLLSRAILWIHSRIRAPISMFVQRHFVLPRVFRRRRLINPTRAEVICCIAYWGITCFFNLYSVTTMTSAARRAGLIAIFNLVPLIISNQLSLLAQVLDVPLHRCLHIHIQLGAMVAVQSLLHGGLHMLKLETPVQLEPRAITVNFLVRI